VENLDPKGTNAQGIHKCDWVSIGEALSQSRYKLLSGSFCPKHDLKVPKRN